MNLSPIPGSNSVTSLGQVSGQIARGSNPSVRRDSSTISSFTLIAGTLQQLQQTSSSDYRLASAKIAANLQQAAQTTGVTSNQSGVLNNLAAEFQNAAMTGQLPNWPTLAHAMSGDGRTNATQLAGYTSDSANGLASVVLGAISRVVG